MIKKELPHLLRQMNAIKFPRSKNMMTITAVHLTVAK